MKKIILLSVCIISSILCFSQATYEIGKVYEINGVKGLVYKVSENGRHGMMMSLNTCPKKKSSFCTNKKLFSTLIATDTVNGQKNMAAVEKYVIDNNLTLATFPIFDWAKSLGDGWYIPSYRETRELLENIYDSKFKNGRLDGKDKTKKIVQKELKDNGGDPIKFPMACGGDYNVSNKKGKIINSYTNCIILQATSGTSTGGLLGAAINIAALAKDAKTDVLIYWSTSKKSKFIGTRAIREF